jgi:UDP-sulfoquinovose synthase
MRVFIAGIDGYLGWSLAQHLLARGHQVAGADCGLRRRWVEEMGSVSAIPIASMADRLQAAADHHGPTIAFSHGDLREYGLVEAILREFEPQTVVHLGECPSAPYSMIDREHAMFVQMNNLSTTFNLLFGIRDLCPGAHLLKLGTMGEYGTPQVPIPEGFFEVEYRGHRDRLPFPRQAGSWYHWSKVHGSNNVMFASRLWGLRATDVMQGVVFGTRTASMGDDPRLRTRLDFDGAFGTAINRFCCQAVIGQRITPYGSGGQKRGFLPLEDSMRCLTLAIENPPVEGEYRVFNQFAEVHELGELALMVQSVAEELGLAVDVCHVENPRKEVEEHLFEPDNQALRDLGYEPTRDVRGVIRDMLEDLLPHRDRIEARQAALTPSIRWDGPHQPVGPLGPPLSATV